MNVMSRRTVFRWLLVLAFVVSPIVSAFADSGAPSVDVSQLRVAEQDVLGAASAQPLGLSGQVQVVVTLGDPPLAAALGEQAKQQGSKLNALQQQGYLRQLARKQDDLMAQVSGFGGKEVTRLSKALNAVVLTVDAKYLKDIAALPNVLSVHLVKNYELDLSETVPYIGAGAVQASGYDGTGVRVAILDSGIDYTHRNLGGAGTAAAYTAAYGTSTSDARNRNTGGFFPTAKVIGGYDFVGDTWPGATGTEPLAPDPDPIDCSPSAIGCGGGHGTHVADIVAGKSSDGLHKGVAPGASLYAVKVCSSVSTACSGVALLQGMDFALDPNGDGNISDAVDVINMSLGSNYGMKEDDLSAASNNASKMGVVVVAAAGNAADRPYIVSSPSSAEEVISVAQTQMPSAKLYLVQATGATAVGANWQPWSAAPALVAAPLQYGVGTNTLGCVAFSAGAFAGKIALLDRGGGCAISLKVQNAEAAGAVAALVANNVSQAPGDLPPDFSFGGGATPLIAAYTLTRVDGAYLRGFLGASTTINPASAVGLVKNMVASSARGPSVSFNAIKPDIGAPGASMSAEAGTGTGETSFGGTSGATPMVAGSAALLVGKYPSRSPREIKALLMNTAEINIGLNPVSLPGVIAPITRIGAGEVRVNQAASTKTAAWDQRTGAPSLSFGYQALNAGAAFEAKVLVRNYSSSPRTYTVANGFRFADDAANGAVSLQFPGSVTVPANSSKTINLVLKVDPAKLPTWTLNGGSFGGDGFRLQSVEFDGYLTISGGGDVVRLPWQILPHKAANDVPSALTVALGGSAGSLTLTNAGGKVAGRFDVFSLTGTSGKIPPPALPRPGDNFAVIDLKSAGVRMVDIGGGAFAVQFAVNTFGERAHPNYPAEFDIYIDSNNDGVFDFVIFNLENTGFGVTGQNVVAVYNLTTGASVIRYYTDADLDSANAILTARLSDLSLTPATKFRFSVFGCDNYFTGVCTDAVENMTYTLGTPRFIAIGAATDVPINGSTNLAISSVAGGAAASPSQSGFLLMYRDAVPKSEASAITVTP